MPDGAVVRGGFGYRAVRDVPFFAEEVVYELEVWKLPGGGRLVAKMPPGPPTCRGLPTSSGPAPRPDAAARQFDARIRAVSR
ncbi:MAG: hypothetical protein OXI01_23595 [Albidovulum sp.]|nr:hypothetical protein [Albidovulum sp.]